MHVQQPVSSPALGTGRSRSLLRPSADTPACSAAQAELLVIGAIWVAVANIVVVGAILIAADRKKSATQVAHWSKGERCIARYGL